MQTILFPKMYRKLFLFFILTAIILTLFVFTNSIHLLSSYLHTSYEVKAASVNVNKLHHYGAIIDAGSSGSRLFLYTWPTHSGNGEELLDIRPLLDSHGNPISKKVTPGLSSFADRPDDVVEYVKKLLDVAAASIPTSQHMETPLYVMATAGMRMISRDAQSKILDNIRKFTKKQYKFLFSDSHAKVITGREEGVYGWITTNYLLGRFDHNTSDGVSMVSVPYGDSPLRSQSVHHRKRTVGVIDMGGGSMQIAYELGVDESRDVVAAKRVNLGCKENDVEHSYKLFVTTFLGFGANTARTRFERMLVRESLSRVQATVGPSQSPYNNDTVIPDRLVIEDPCLHPGLELSSSVRLVNDSQGGLDLSAKKLRLLPLVNATFRGTGSYIDCKTRVAVLLDKKSCSNDEDKSLRCVMAGKLHPRLDLQNMQFYGFSEFWYSTNDVFELGGLYNYFKLHSKAVEHCRENWFSVILRQKKGVYRRADWPRLRYQCFKSAWITTVLHEGLGFPSTYDKFTTVMEVKGAEVQWTLGALLYQTRYFPLRVIEEQQRMRRRELLQGRGRASGTHAYLLLGAVLIVALILLWVHTGHRWTRSYLRRPGARDKHSGSYSVISLDSERAPPASTFQLGSREFTNWA